MTTSCPSFVVCIDFLCTFFFQLPCLFLFCIFFFSLLLLCVLGHMFCLLFVVLLCMALPSSSHLTEPHRSKPHCTTLSHTFCEQLHSIHRISTDLNEIFVNILLTPTVCVKELDTCDDHIAQFLIYRQFSSTVLNSTQYHRSS